jgi:hypothetical protein
MSMRRLRSLVILLLLTTALTAQVIEASVKVEMPLLLPEEKIPLQNFQSRLQDYINANDWYPDPDREIIITTNIQIIIQSVYEGNSGYIYVAQFLISSESGENFYDKSWDFPYLPDEFWNYPITQIHPITSLIDFYLHMVLGGEMDTFEELGGNADYEYALQVSNQAINSAYSKGWSQRKQILLEYTSEFTTPLRRAKLVYYDVLNANREANYALQLEYAEEFLQLLEQTSRFQGNNRPLERYMEKNARQIAQFFVPSPLRQEYYKRLVAIDSRFSKDYARFLGIEE